MTHIGMKHIGVLAHSADGAALAFLEMVREGARRLGDHRHPEISMSMLPMGEVLGAWERMDLPAINAFLHRTADRLAAAGCDFFVCPDNTAHIAFEAPGVQLPLPGLNIGEIVVARAKADGRAKIGLLGTKWTMEGPVYRAACARHGLALDVPPAEDRALVDRVIFEELTQGRVRLAAQAQFRSIIERLKESGCDCVALSCTEIPLLIPPEVSALPTLDSTRLLARAAVAVALGAAPAPTWRGGPLA